MSRDILRGSCLCGAVQYQVTGEAKRFYHCHCSRCRKPTGTGHASNLSLQPGALKWLSGEEHILFAASRASWSCFGDGIPVHAEAPSAVQGSG